MTDAATAAPQPPSPGRPDVRLPAPATPPALAGRKISVSFGELRAVADVSVSFAPGQLHVVVGQNGAGKTTLARVFAGLMRPDTGSVLVDGRDVPVGEVTAARQAGVEMVHQNFTLPPSFTVAEALELFSTRRRAKPAYSLRGLREQWREELQRSGVRVDVGARIRDLPIEAMQAIEITRALAADARILILDEPTGVLPPPAVERLFERLRSLRDSGVTVILVLHKLREVAAIAQTVTVLREGRLVLEPAPVGAIGSGELSDLIVGGALHQRETPPVGAAADVVADEGRTELLRLGGISTRPTATDPGLDDLSLAIRRGEILGVAGVEGNGQRALVSAITGLEPVTTGAIAFAGEAVTGTRPAHRRARGLRAVPFDRNSQGVSQSSTLWENVAILAVVAGHEGGRAILRLGRLRETARRAMDHWRVRYRSIDQRAGELSGGNIQRLILARELSVGVRLLIAAQPTRGLDVAATAFVRATLRELRDAEGGVLLISSDLDELFELSDRLVVLLAGRIAAEFRPPFDVRLVGDAMVGAERGEASAA